MRRVGVRRWGGLEGLEPGNRAVVIHLGPRQNHGVGRQAQFAPDVFRVFPPVVDVTGVFFTKLLFAALLFVFELFPPFAFRYFVREMAVCIRGHFLKPYANPLNVFGRFKSHFFESIERGESLFDSMVELEQDGINTRFHRFNLPSAQIGDGTSRLEAVKSGRGKREYDNVEAHG